MASRGLAGIVDSAAAADAIQPSSRILASIGTTQKAAQPSSWYRRCYVAIIGIEAAIRLARGRGLVDLHLLQQVQLLGHLPLLVRVRLRTAVRGGPAVVLEDVPLQVLREDSLWFGSKAGKQLGVGLVGERVSATAYAIPGIEIDVRQARVTRRPVIACWSIARNVSTVRLTLFR